MDYHPSLQLRYYFFFNLKKKKLSEIKLPNTINVEEIKKYLEFAQKNGVRIYSTECINYHPKNISENKTFLLCISINVTQTDSPFNDFDMPSTKKIRPIPLSFLSN